MEENKTSVKETAAVQQPREYKEERFEFAIFVNDNLVCKRNFKIFNFIENSMNTLEFKDTVDNIVKLIDDDLKSKSRVYTWYYYNAEDKDENNEFNSPLLDPWQCTLKFVVYDNKREVISKIWDGYAYPRAIREKIDLSNKWVRMTTKDGKVYTYEKESYLAQNEGRLTPEMYVVKAMIGDKSDVLLQITKRICEACSPSWSEIKESDANTYQAVQKFIDNYTTKEEFKNRAADGSVTGPSTTYALTMKEINKKVEADWANAVSKKTKEYFKNLYN